MSDNISEIISSKEVILKKAFTLAEVLITLGIIGVVAAMTLPSLINNYRDKEIVTKVRKTYSDIYNTINHARTSDGNINDNSVLFNPENSSTKTAQNFIKYFNGAKLCPNNKKECKQYYYNIKYSRFYTGGTNTGVIWSHVYPAIILNNGAILYIVQKNYPDCYSETTYEKHDEAGRPILDEDGNKIILPAVTRICGYVYFDVNGPKSPNRFGYDAYYIQISKDKVEPSIQPYLGLQSLENILSGKDNFIFSDYTVGAEK